MSAAQAVRIRKVVSTVSQIQIPIFPIKSVLFPGTLVRLKVVDPRYRALLDTAVALHDRRFGVALTREETGGEGDAALHSIGTLAQILHLTREKGHAVNIIAVGRERFRIVSLDRAGVFPTASVEDAPIRAVASPEVLALEHKVRAIATEYFAVLLNLGEDDSDRLKLPAAAVPLAHFIAANVQIPLDLRQHLLEFNELEGLLGEEIGLLERELTRLQWFESQRRLRPKGPTPYSLN